MTKRFFRPIRVCILIAVVSFTFAAIGCSSGSSQPSGDSGVGDVDDEIPTVELGTEDGSDSADSSGSPDGSSDQSS